MKKQDHIKLEAFSQLDDEIIARNVQKRYFLLRGINNKSSSRWIPIIAMAAVFAIIVSSIFLFLPDNSHVAPPSDKQVPIYQGMTVSNEAPVVEMEARVNYSMPLFGAIGTRLKPTDKPNKDTPEISGGPYYAQPNEDIYIYVHISNPDGFEILSFTLNGVKYSSYMFEAGSDLETLILKYNVGEKEGIQQYTIDAIKYVDGEDIKDVRMDGERTIEVLVGNDAQDLTFATQFDGWDLVITPKWAGTFAGEKKILSLAVYDGERLLRELTPSTTVIKDLPMDKRLLLVATYLDNGKTVTVKTVFQTLKQSEGLTITNGVVTGFGTCTDTVMYINMPIGEKAFKDNAHIKQIIFGSGVTSIGSEAFSGCTKLTDIVIPSTVTRMGHGVFAGCTSLKSVVLENALISIPNTDNLFYNCTSLTSFTIPGSVTSIGVSAFEGCTGLASIMIPDSVTSIENAAFKGCIGFTSIVIPDSVTSIGEYAFASTALTSITIPGSVTSIGEYAFASTALTSITIPNSVTSIGFGAFNGCTRLTSMTIPFVGATISGNANTHFGYLFGAGNYVDNSSSVPSTLTTVVVMGGNISESAFYGCSSLTSITLPDSVTSIGSYAFSGCSSLTSITIPNSVTSIGEYAFASSALTSITIPDSVTSIGFNAFNGCTGLTSMTLPFVGATKSGDANTHFGYLFGAKDNKENSSSVPSTLTTVVVMGGEISDYAFDQCGSLTNITMSGSVTSIGGRAFAFCSSLTSVTIGNSVTSIDERAFLGCSSLTSINYTGTKKQWSAINKIVGWNDTITVTVHCSDGDVIV